MGTEKVAIILIVLRHGELPGLRDMGLCTMTIFSGEIQCYIHISNSWTL